MAIVEINALESPLTKREKEVLLLTALGYNAEQIGSELFISARTVEIHRKHIIQKLSAKNITNAVYRALMLKIIWFYTPEH